jgi:predicted DNA-binding transcriptional regulator AlpA
MSKKTNSPQPVSNIPPDLPRLYRTDEVAAMLGITSEKLKALRRQGRGPKPIKIGPKTIRYRMSAIEEYFAVNEATGDYVWQQSPRAKTEPSEFE